MSWLARSMLVGLAMGACGDAGHHRDAGIGGHADAAADASAVDARQPDGAARACTTPGALDEQFGASGFTAPLFVDARWAGANAVALDAQGRIVVAGSSPHRKYRAAFTVVRYLADGTLDTTFGDNGVTRVCADGFVECWLVDVAIDVDGSIVGVGGMNHAMGGNVGMIRLTPDGALDAGFGVDGIVADQTSPIGHAVAVALDSHRRIVIVEEAADGIEPADARYFQTVRYLPTGARDPAFGTGGIAQPAFAPGRHIPGDLTLDAQDRPVVVGQWNPQADGRFGVVRYATDGTRDPSFGTGGVVTVEIGDASMAMGVALDAAQNLVLVGVVEPASSAAIARLRPDGTLDPAFGDAGLAPAFHEPHQKVAVAADGKLVSVGWQTPAVYAQVLSVARYLPSGAPDTAFGMGGMALAGTGSPAHLGNDLAIQPDGKIIAVGARGHWQTGLDFFVARFCP